MILVIVRFIKRATIIFTIKFAENGTTTFLDNRLLLLIKKYGLFFFQRFVLFSIFHCNESQVLCVRALCEKEERI